MGAAGALAILGFRAFGGDDPDQPKPPAKDPDTKFVLRIHNRHEVKDEDSFKQLLATSGLQLSHIHMRHSNKGTHHGEEEEFPSRGGAQLELKTDKVVVSEVASSGEYTAIGVHVTQLVASSNPADIAKVLDALKP